MRVAYVRDDAQIGADHPFERAISPRCRDTRLDQPRSRSSGSAISSDSATPICEL